MGKFNYRSIILGIGIGLILASLLNMIYLAGEQPKDELSNEEIINKAIDLGMVPASNIIKDFDTRQKSDQDMEPHKSPKPR